MGDARHKNPPPEGPEEDVTDEFRDEVKAVLDRNRSLNKLSGAVEGEPKYMIASQAALARALGTSDKQVSNILGPVREDSKWDRVDRSTYVQPIREVLGLNKVTTIQVPAERAPLLSWFSSLPPEEWEHFETALEAARQRAAKRS